jgi:hypothetical protein
MDKYDVEIERLQQLTPQEIRQEWAEIKGPLFEHIASLRMCLTEIRHEKYPYPPTESNDKLRKLIRADNRIPYPIPAQEIDPATLPIFAEWQRRIDAEFPECRIPVGDWP